MKLIYSILVICLTCSCSESIKSELSDELDKAKTYSLNSYPRGTNYIFSVTYKDNIAYINRNEVYEIDKNAPINIFYSNSRNYEVTESNYLKIKDSRKNLWFVPTFLGSEPILLSSSVKCFRFYCNCDGTASPAEDPSCDVQKDQMGVIRCETVVNATQCPGEPGWGNLCIGMAAIVACNGASGSGDDNWTYEGYPGGLLIEAGSIEITDPEWFKPSNSRNKLDFISPSPGEVYIKTEYEEYQRKINGSRD